jgi:hypothetical protein
LLRIAENTARPFEEITSDGTLLCGIIQGNTEKILEILKKAQVPREHYNIETERIETHWQLLQELETQLKHAGCRLEIIEKYPTYDALVVEKIPL